MEEVEEVEEVLLDEVLQGINSKIRLVDVPPNINAEIVESFQALGLSYILSGSEFFWNV